MKTLQFIDTCAVFGAYNDAAAWHLMPDGKYYVTTKLGAFSNAYKAVVDDYGTLVPVYRYMF